MPESGGHRLKASTIPALPKPPVSEKGNGHTPTNLFRLAPLTAPRDDRQRPVELGGTTRPCVPMDGRAFVLPPTYFVNRIHPKQQL